MRSILFAFAFAAVAPAAQPDLLTRPPALLARCAPRYTAAARAAKLEGTVRLYVEVSPRGRAINVKVLKPLATGLDESAIETVKQWRFRPGLKNGEPAAYPASIDVNFSLDDPATPCPAGHQ